MQRAPTQLASACHLYSSRAQLTETGVDAVCVPTLASAIGVKTATPIPQGTSIDAQAKERGYPTLLQTQNSHHNEHTASSHEFKEALTGHSPPGSLRTMAKWCFGQVCNGQGVPVGGLVQLRKVLSQVLGMPESAFGSMQVQHMRFDLDGSGLLNENELYRLMKMNLREYRRRAGQDAGAAVPTKSLQSAGYQIIDKLGKGNQCKALLGKDQKGQRCCIKAFEKARMSTHDVNNINQEYEVLNSIAGHPTIPTVLDIFQDKDTIYTVNTLHEGGDFTTLRQRAPLKLRTEKWWRDIFRQCFEGLGHLHENSLMHCDIKESNIMLKTTQYHQPEVVIIDFGLSQTAASDATLVSGTPGYIPPEVWETGKWYPGGDMFSMGVVIMQMLLNRVPPHHNPPQGFEVLPNGIFTEGTNSLREAGLAAKSREPPFDSMPLELADLTAILKRLLTKDVKKRPLAPSVLGSAWFSGDEEDEPPPLINVQTRAQSRVQSTPEKQKQKQSSPVEHEKKKKQSTPEKDEPPPLSSRVQFDQHALRLREHLFEKDMHRQLLVEKDVQRQPLVPLQQHPPGRSDEIVQKPQRTSKGSDNWGLGEMVDKLNFWLVNPSPAA